MVVVVVVGGELSIEEWNLKNFLLGADILGLRRDVV